MPIVYPDLSTPCQVELEILPVVGEELHLSRFDPRILKKTGNVTIRGLTPCPVSFGYRGSTNRLSRSIGFRMITARAMAIAGRNMVVNVPTLMKPSFVNVHPALGIHCFLCDFLPAMKTQSPASVTANPITMTRSHGLASPEPDGVAAGGGDIPPGVWPTGGPCC